MKKRHKFAWNVKIAIVGSVTLLFLYFLFMEKYSSGFIDSDMSSELILAKMLSEKSKLLSSEWYYSTELRVLNTQLVFMPLFKVFSSFHVVRVIGSTILIMILYFCACFFGKTYGLSWCGSLVFGQALLLPYWGGEYSSIVLKGVYYVPHLAVSFVTLGLIFIIGKTKSRHKIVMYEISIAILSLFAGMGGLRQLLVLYLPLVGGNSDLSKNKNI